MYEIYSGALALNLFLADKLIVVSLASILLQEIKNSS
jgi:hypothetical protein